MIKKQKTFLIKYKNTNKIIKKKILKKNNKNQKD